MCLCVLCVHADCVCLCSLPALWRPVVSCWQAMRSGCWPTSESPPPAEAPAFPAAQWTELLFGAPRRRGTHPPPAPALAPPPHPAPATRHLCDMCDTSPRSSQMPAQNICCTEWQWPAPHCGFTAGPLALLLGMGIWPLSAPWQPTRRLCIGCRDSNLPISPQEVEFNVQMAHKSSKAGIFCTIPSQG